jgi:hypothetical protein
MCSLTMLPIVIIGGFELTHFTAKEWWILAALIGGAQILGHSMFNSVLKRVSPAVVSLIVFFEVPVAAIGAKAFNIGNQPSSLIIPGIALILIGCSLVVLRTRPSKETNETLVNQ